MLPEQVVSLTDRGRPIKVDINNGFVYDAQGNDLGRWSLKDSTEEGETAKLCADFASARMRGAMLSAHGERIAGEALVERLMSAARTKGDERAVLMALGNADVHIPSALPNVAMGYRNEAPIADMVAPPLLVNKPTDKYFVFDPNDAYEIASPLIGAGAAQPPEISPRLANQQFATTEFALGGFIPTQLDGAADAPLRLRQATMKRILNVLTIRRETRVSNLVSNGANWNSANVVTLGAGFNWNGGASSDPVKDIQGRVEASLGGITGIAMSEPIWHAFQRNPAVQKYFTYKDGSAALPNPAQMQAILDLPPIYVARMKIRAPSGGAQQYIWGNSVVLFRQPEQMPPITQDDIATAYTFRWNATNVPDSVAGMAGFASSGGFVVREFYNQVRGSMGGSQIVCVHHDAEVQTSAFVGGLVAAAFQ